MRGIDTERRGGSLNGSGIAEAVANGEVVTWQEYVDFCLCVCSAIYLDCAKGSQSANGFGISSVL